MGNDCNGSKLTIGVRKDCCLRPDIIAVKNENGFKIVEVASKSQTSGRALNSLMNNYAIKKILLVRIKLFLFHGDIKLLS